MNIKILIGIIVIVVIGAVLLGSSKKGNSGTATQTQEQASPTTQPSVSEGAVEITSSGFTPETITIKAGTKVVWTNKSGELAAINSDLHPTHSIYPPLNLNQVTNNGSVSLVLINRERISITTI
ncbi:hypothetical protein HY041_03220 [Candidatus Roizmanbacteria bacterium]|nr:hypothetical protein [Candidatus Roizmanbacteria bacterium]